MEKLKIELSKSYCLKFHSNSNKICLITNSLAGQLCCPAKRPKNIKQKLELLN